MKPSIQKYAYAKSATFSGALWVKSWEGVLLMGGIENAGLLVCLDRNNQVKWTRELVPANHSCWFTHAKETPDGDVLVYGHLRISNNSGRHIILKVDSAGTKKFCKQIYSEKSRRSVSFLPLSNDQFLISGWVNKAGGAGDDSIETISVSAQGDPTYRVMWVKGSSDDQLLGSCITEDTSNPNGSSTCVFQVGTSSIGGIKGFLAKGAGGIKPFNIVGGKYFSVNGANATQLEAVISPDTHRFVVAGTYTTAGQTTNRTILISGEYRGLTAANQYFQIDKALGFKFLTGNERVRSIYLINGYLYILGFDLTSLTSFIAKFDKQLNPLWPSSKSFNFTEKTYITDITDAGNNTLYISGFFREGPNNIDSPLVICTDYELTTCKTADLTITQDGAKVVTVNEWPCEPKDLDPLSAQMGDLSALTPAAAEELCPTPGLTLGNNALIQSPYLYLQAAGSDGLESTAGIHLRWFLLRNLGNTHLPKGNYAATTHNFNKPDDYVRVYRAPYTPGGIGFKINSLNAFTANHQAGLWVYKLPNVSTVLYLWWRNIDRYKQVASQNALGSDADVDSFFEAYFQTPANNYIEIEIKGDLAFAYQAIVTPTGLNASNFKFKTEAFSVEGNFPGAVNKISARKEFSNIATPIRIVGENLKFIRYSVKSGKLAVLVIETYGAFIQNALSNNTIEKIGDFALTKNTTEAHLRLEDTSRQVNVHDNWKKFNGNAKINVANYQKRWEDSSNLGTGLAQGVSDYIALSDNASNPTAKKILPANTPNTPDLEVSFLDMLLLAGTDFHAARMLGLGYIDTPLGITPTGLIADTYIYIIEYHTSGLLDNSPSPQNVQHLFLSLPTANKDHRLPEKLTISSLTYGLTVQANTPTPISITDSNGYTPDGKSRFINLWAELENNYALSNGFFDPAIEFESSRFTAAIMAGVEYKKKNNAAWQEPELAHEDNYTDTKGILETIPIVFKENSVSPLFIHQEKDPGFHEYAVYAVNIFSRTSDLSAPLATNETQFTKANSLLPPTDLRVQLIQDEGPLLLTTQEEQDYFQLLNGDKTLVRLTFNYHHVHDENYNFGDKVEVFYRKEIPRNVRGGIASIVNNTDKRFATITTTDYTYASNGQVETPQIPTGLVNNFIGGVMVLNGHRYKIENIQLPGGNPKTPTFTVWKEEDRSMQSGAGQSAMTQTFSPIHGAQGDLFMVIENMAKADSWGTPNPLTLVVQIGNSQWKTESETFENSNGDIVTRSLRGFWDDADISVDHLEDQKDQNGKILKTTAVYKIAFKTLKINNHPQYAPFNAANPKNSVNWFKGVIRIRLKGQPKAERRVLPVIGIENVGNGQITIVYAHCDDAYDPNRFAPQARVNFYPGYRLYIHSESAKGFTSANLLPAFGEGSRQSLMGVRSWDSSNNYRSPMGVPAILLAQEIIAPLQPEKPIGPAYATPPDKYFKSAYTFSVPLASRNPGQKPYAVVFYRADLKAILSALYKQETIELIVKDLPDPLEDADYFTARWQNLIGFDFIYNDPNLPFYDATGSSINGTFRKFPAGTGYQFPNPDNPDFGFNGNKTPDKITSIMQEAIYSVFLPLTKEPILYADIESNKDIKPAKPAKLNGNKVQFTDFTLDGAMKTSYFYCAREMGNTMQLGELSSIMGPIQLINTDPPQTPIVQKVVTQIADSFNGVDTAVRFELLPFLPHDNIKKIYIYRTNNSTDALSVRTMGEPTKKIDFDPKQSTNPVIVVDDFTNDPEIPFGDPLYFRLVALREVKYKDFALKDVVDYVPSQPTKILLSNVVDLENPEAPEITATVKTSTNKELKGVKINWNKTTYFGVYRLFKMNNSGNWNKIFEVKSNNPFDLVHSFSDPLPILDEDGNAIYHHFKVSVESTSGLLNLKDKIFTLGGN